MIITFTGTWQDYYTVTRPLVLLNSCTPVLLNSCIPCIHAPCIVTLLITQSYRRPAEHAAWCRDEEDVSHNRASVRWILNGTKCHTEQSATSHMWWEPPLESMGAISRIHFPHRAKCHTEQSATPHMWWGPPVESVGPPLESVGLPPESTLRAKCHIEQSVTPHTWWGPLLESVGATS